MTNLALVDGGTTVTLPLNPSRFTFAAAADTKEVMNPTARSILISFGRKVDKLTVEGTIWNAGDSAETLYTNYLSPITGMVYHSVHLDNVTRYHDNWVLTNFEYREVGGMTNHFEYKMEFIRGVNGSGTTPGIVIT